MEYERKKEGYGHLMNWIIGLGDMILINLFFLVWYKLSSSCGFDTTETIDNINIKTAILLINLIYLVVANILPTQLSANIIFFDKIIQRSVSFITLFFILFMVGCTLFNAGTLSWSSVLVLYLTLCTCYTLWQVILRIVIKKYRKQGRNYKRIVIIGNDERVLDIYHEMKSGDYGYKILGFFSQNKSEDMNDLPFLGNLSEVYKFCSDNTVDEIYCTLPSGEETAIVSLVNFAEKNLIRFYLVPDFYAYIQRKFDLTFLQSTPVITIKPESLQLLSNRILKRTFDIFFSVLVLITIFPIAFIIFSVLIKLSSSGPIFFKQQRTGLRGKSFYCYKFRSMIINADSDSKVTTKGDDRVTSIGKFMRRTSIDELPQFFNVLIGNMSVVGPRPHMLQQTELYNQLIDKFMIRHAIKPGITGWAQVSGYRGETTTTEQMEGRFKKDIWYIENWSFMLDLKIVIVTIFMIIKGDDKAY